VGHSVGERRRGEGSCTSTVQHEGLVDVAEPVYFVIGTLKSDLQLFLDGLEVLDMADGCVQKDEYKEKKEKKKVDIPRSRMDTLLAFWLEAGRVSLRRAYPSLSSSRLRCSDSMRCLRTVSRRESREASVAAMEPPGLNSSSSSSSESS